MAQTNSRKARQRRHFQRLRAETKIRLREIQAKAAESAPAADAAKS